MISWLRRDLLYSEHMFSFLIIIGYIYTSAIQYKWELAFECLFWLSFGCFLIFEEGQTGATGHNINLKTRKKCLNNFIKFLFEILAGAVMMDVAWGLSLELTLSHERFAAFLVVLSQSCLRTRTPSAPLESPCAPNDRAYNFRILIILTISFETKNLKLIVCNK